MNPEFLELGQKIRLLRKKAGMTQKQLAEKAGLTQHTICVVECGRAGITLQTADLIAAALNVSLEELSSVVRKEDVEDALRRQLQM